MNNLNYSISKTISLLLQQLKISSFISVILTCILLGVILYINRANKIIKYIFIGINIVLLVFVLALYIKNIVPIK